MYVFLNFINILIKLIKIRGRFYGSIIINVLIRWHRRNLKPTETHSANEFLLLKDLVSLLDPKSKSIANLRNFPEGFIFFLNKTHIHTTYSNFKMKWSINNGSVLRLYVRLAFCSISNKIYFISAKPTLPRNEKIIHLGPFDIQFATP